MNMKNELTYKRFPCARLVDNIRIQLHNHKVALLVLGDEAHVRLHVDAVVPDELEGLQDAKL